MQLFYEATPKHSQKVHWEAIHRKKSNRCAGTLKQSSPAVKITNRDAFPGNRLPINCPEEAYLNCRLLLSTACTATSSSCCWKGFGLGFTSCMCLSKTAHFKLLNSFLRVGKIRARFREYWNATSRPSHRNDDGRKKWPSAFANACTRIFREWCPYQLRAAKIDWPLANHASTSASTSLSTYVSL